MQKKIRVVWYDSQDGRYKKNFKLLTAENWYIEVHVERCRLQNLQSIVSRPTVRPVIPDQKNATGIPILI